TSLGLRINLNMLLHNEQVVTSVAKRIVMQGDQLFAINIGRLVAIDVSRGKITGAKPAEGAKFPGRCCRWWC
ncbi:MAG: hypothetical protein OER56_06980, partial [Hyphomicrobiales bacterium]|nr:hypothetical protein [Hyphomicrobiales bacterium]